MRPHPPMPLGSAFAVGALLLIVLGTAGPGARAADPEDFETWMSALREEAIERGISPAIFQAALANVEPQPVVLKLDRSQPTAPSGFCSYLDKRLTPTRIARGRRELATHEALLQEIVHEYGVPARYLVALWGLETNFGDYQGDHPLFDTLVTLARDPRRGDLFRAQIFAALEMVEAGHPADGMAASWAGAMGQVQFMPTTYQAYAVDHDGDGRKDIWTSLPDAFASAANFLRKLGWRSGETWGRQVAVPGTFGREQIRGTRSLAAWRELGLRRVDGSALPEGRLRGRLILPLKKPDPAFLVYPNYRIFMSWNRSTFFSISVGTLADEIGGRSTLRACGNQPAPSAG